MTVAPNQNRLTVLLANDQEQWHCMVRDLLAPQGVQTVTARSGREALDILEKQAIHLAVLDAHMPQLGGLQVIKLVREHLAKAGRVCPPAILLASPLTSHLQHEALSMQIFSILAKPVDPNLLLQSMARALARYHQNRWPSLS
ncbi:MAG TPA: response regulator [Tepidisphaeraceae bacterium]|jgi:CheY-like chemotaxis protein